MTDIFTAPVTEAPPEVPEPTTEPAPKPPSPKSDVGENQYG